MTGSSKGYCKGKGETNRKIKVHKVLEAQAEINGRLYKERGVWEAPQSPQLPLAMGNRYNLVHTPQQTEHTAVQPVQPYSLLARCDFL
jgi:hypothetical protein